MATHHAAARAVPRGRFGGGRGQASRPQGHLGESKQEFFSPVLSIRLPYV
jgi:hypothetical protein